jgi:hypothetical protein
MSVEYCSNDYQKYPENILIDCCFVHHKSHVADMGFNPGLHLREDLLKHTVTSLELIAKK